MYLCFVYTHKAILVVKKYIFRYASLQKLIRNQKRQYMKDMLNEMQTCHKIRNGGDSKKNCEQ